MKKESWVDQLSKATKGTVVVCGILLVLCAAGTMLLMLFPIKKVDNPTVVVEPARHTEYSATTAATTVPPATTKPAPQTLSTWDAGVHGYSRSRDEFIETEEWQATTDPRLYREPTEAPVTEAPQPVTPPVSTLEEYTDSPSVETQSEAIVIIPDEEDEEDDEDESAYIQPPLPEEYLPGN